MSGLRVLFVAEEAAEASLRQLLEARDRPVSRCVSDGKSLTRSLADSEWDAVVVAELHDALSIETVVGILRDHHLRAPVIAVVRDAGAEAAADLMRAGACDVVAMDNGARLRAALARETGAARPRDFPDAKELLENIASHVPGDIYRRVLHADGRVTYPFISGGFIERLGYAIADIDVDSGLLAEMVHEEDREAYRTAYANSAQSLAPFDHRWRMRGKSGADRWVHGLAGVRRLDNGDIVWDGVTIDVTREMEIEGALRESETRLANIAENLPGSVFSRVLHTDRTMSYPYASGYMEREFGIGRTGKSSFVDAIHPDDRAIWEEAVTYSVARRAPFDLTYRLRTADGDVRWVQTRAGVRTLAGGEVVWDGITLDVTAYQRTEQALQERTAQLESLASNIPGVVYRRVQYPNGRVVFPYISKGAKYIYGYSAEELMADPTPFRHAALPEDQEWHDKGAELSAETMQPWVWEGRIRRKDGRLRWVHVHARPHPLPDGATAWDGFVLDVTSRTLAEQAARETAGQIESLAANLPGVVFRRIQYPDGRLEYPFLSSRVRDLFGYSAQEMTANPSLLQAVATEAEQREHDALTAHSARTLEPWQMEYRVRHRDGSLKWVHGWAQPHKRDDGAVVWDGVTMDVSDRKLAEVELDTLARQQSAVVALGQHALGGTLQTLFEAAVEAIAITLSADLASVLELDAHRETLRLVAARGWPEGSVGKNVFPNNESVPAGYALRTRRPVIISDAAKDARFKLPPALKTQGVVSGLSIAIGPPERPFGALSVYTRRPRDFSVQDADFMRAVANVLAAAAERERTERDRRKLSSVVEQSPNAIVIADADGLVEYANQAHEAMTGFRRNEVVGAHMLPWADRRARDGQSRAIRDSVLAGKTWRGERQQRRKTGEVFWSQEMVMGVRDGAGRIAGVASIFEDVTERKHVEAQLAQASKLSTLGEMASGLTHELNQPLNIIRMAADSCLILMEEDSTDLEHQAQQLEVISGQTQRMAEIINHMRIFSRKDQVEVEPFDPSNSVHAAVRLVSEQLRLAEISLSISAPQMCRPVLGHPLRLEQVVINLLNNAKDAVQARRGGAPGKIALELTDDGKANTIDIRVTDNGGGIAPDVLEHIFEPFYTTKDPGKGTGLGLSIVYAIVTSMGGTISAENTGEGARFTVSLPVDPGFETERQRRAATRGGQA